MSEWIREKAAQNWSDGASNDDDFAYEKTYKDGSIKNECWKSDDSVDETLRFSLDEIRFE